MKILVAYPTLSSFVARDIKILRQSHHVQEFQFFSQSPANQYKGIKSLADADLLYLWFASLRSVPLALAASARGIPIVTVIGGYEVADYPEINYGSARSTSARSITRWILRRSRAVLTVSKSSQNELVRNLHFDDARTQLVYHGFERIDEDSRSPKQSVVLTVGNVTNMSWLKKGHREFFQIAAMMPDVSFVHVGKVTIDVEKMLGRKLTPNVTLTGHVPFAELAKIYGPAKVYLQLSRHESFGCSVAEAMLFRCIPVVRNAYALPEVVGDCGQIVNDESLDSALPAIRSALATDDSAGNKCRQRILTEFSYDRRASAILSLIDNIDQNRRRAGF